MNRRNAALHLARRYPDWDALANLMKKNPDTLRKELTGAPGYKWGVDDEELLIALCQAARVDDSLAPLTAAAANAGALLLPLPGGGSGSPATHQCMAEAVQGFGNFIATSSEACADLRVTANELKATEAACGRHVAKVQAFMTHMRALHESCMPPGAGVKAGGKKR